MKLERGQVEKKVGLCTGKNGTFCAKSPSAGSKRAGWTLFIGMIEEWQESTVLQGPASQRFSMRASRGLKMSESFIRVQSMRIAMDGQNKKRSPLDASSSDRESASARAEHRSGGRRPKPDSRRRREGGRRGTRKKRYLGVRAPWVSNEAAQQLSEGGASFRVFWGAIGLGLELVACELLQRDGGNLVDVVVGLVDGSGVRYVAAKHECES